jgi:hypothetical protein
VQGTDRLRTGDRRLGAVLAPAQVDDRDIEVVDIADQVERLLATGGLMDLEAVFEHPADSEAD